FHEDGTGVAQPHAVGRPMVKVQPREIRALPLQHAVRALLRSRVVDKNVHVLNAGEPAHDLAVHPWNRLKLLRPVLRIVRPGDPGGSMRSPLGGHSIAVVFQLRHSRLFSQSETGEMKTPRSERERRISHVVYFAIALVSTGSRGLYFFASSGVETTSLGFGFTAFSTSTPITYSGPNMLLVKNTIFLSGEKRTFGSW